MDTRKIKYLDPKNDLTFRKIFGEHPNIMKSFLNSILPLNKGQYIESITYEDPAMIPELPELKHSIVDVKCTDNYDRQFIVEMQMYWTNSFKNRMLFNSGKAYVKQIDRGHKYAELKPVYGISLINDTFMTAKEYENQYYHNYRLAHAEFPNEIIKGIELIFIELPKFKAQNFTDKKMKALWLRFLTEIDEDTQEVPKELLENQEIKAALEQLQISAFTKRELAYYDKYWDKIRVEKAAIDDIQTAMDDVKKELQKAKQKEKEAKQKEEEAISEKEEAKHKEKQLSLKYAKVLKELGKSVDEITKETGLSESEIKGL